MASRLRRIMTWRTWHEDLLRLSVVVLVVVAFLEAFVGRAISRAAPLIPRSEATTALFEALGRIGVFLFNLGTILVLLVLLLLLWSMRIGVRHLPLASEQLSLVASVFIALALGSFVIRDPAMLVVQSILFLAASVGLLMSTAMSSRSPWPRAFAALIATVYGASRYFVLASALGQIGGAQAAPVGGLELLRIAEAAASLAPIPLLATVYFATPERSTLRTPTWISTAAAALFVLAFVANPAIMAAIAESSLGFTLFLPFPVYALGLSLAIAAFFLLRRNPSTRGKAYGIVLVMIAGIDLRLTYQALLALAGLILWAIEEERPRPTTATLARTVPVPSPVRAVDSEPAARGGS